MARRSSSGRGLVLLVGWLAVLGGVLVVFHGLGAGRLAPPQLSAPTTWGGWAAGRDPLVVVAAVGRLLVLGLAWYLVAVTVFGVAARMVRTVRLVALVDAVSLPVVRGIVQRAFGAGLVLATAVAAPTGAALAEPLPIPLSTVEHAGSAEDDPGAVRDRPLPLRLFDDRPRPEDTAPLLGPPAAHHYEVVAGDSLWGIAVAALEAVWGRPVADGEVVHYWLEVIGANRERLVDPANPDLILPGQQFVLPPPPTPPG